MRELKFRVWDKLAKNFIYPDKGYQGHYILSLEGKFHNLQNGSGGDEYVVQQYTGLEDSEGREIYEGDILEIRGTRKGVVDFKHGAYCVFYPEGSTLSFEFLHSIADFLISGNVLEENATTPALEAHEQFAFYEAGLAAHGCLEKLDDYAREAIRRYGRLLLKFYKQTITNIDLYE